MHSAARHSVRDDKVLFELLLERVLHTTQESWGTPDIRPRTDNGRPHRSAVRVRLHSWTGRGAQQQSHCSPAEGLLGMRQF